MTALAKKHGKTLVESNFDGDYVAQPEMSVREAQRAYKGSAALRDRMNWISPDVLAIAGAEGSSRLAERSRAILQT